MLADEGVRTAVIDPVQVLPISEALLERAERAQAVVAVEDGVAARGIGAAIGQRLAQRATRTRPMPLMRTLGVAQEFIPHATRAQILADQGLDAAGIARSVREALA